MKNKNIEQLQRIIRKEENTSWSEKIPAKAKQSTLRKNDAITQRPQLKVYVNKMVFEGSLNHYSVMGPLPQDESCLKVTLVIADPLSDKRVRDKYDLYEREQVEQCITTIVRTFHEDEEAIRAELLMLIDLIEKERDNQVEKQTEDKKPDNLRRLVPTEEKAAIELLSKPDLMERTYKLLRKANISGYLDITKMLFIASASYKTNSPLHVSLIGSRNNVKRCIDQLMKLLPAEDVLYLNDVSARSLYHCTNDELVNKALLLPNGLDKKAERALNLLQEGNNLRTATTIKDRLGNMISSLKQVKSHFSSVLYNENETNDVGTIYKINVDENAESLKNAIAYENAIFSGEIDIQAEEKSQVMVQNMVRMIKPMEVINPFAGKIKLPFIDEEPLKLNRIYNSMVKQLCLFHQYQRVRDGQRRLIAEYDDAWIAGLLIIDTMVIGNKDMDPKLKEVYNNIRKYVNTLAGSDASQFHFKLRDLRLALGMGKNYCFRYVDELYKLEYLERGGAKNKGYTYRLAYWEEDKIAEKREAMKTNLRQQLDALMAGDLKKKAS